MIVRVTASALVAAAVAAAAAGALEGVYEIADVISMDFRSDGTVASVVAALGGTATVSSYTVEGETLTLTSPADHPVCPNAVGVYTFVETETGMTLTLVSDACQTRADTFNGAAFT